MKDRLTKEITYWDHRAEQLKLQEQAGKPNARLNSGEARKRADDLQARLQKRLEELKLEAPDLAAAAGRARRAAGRAGGPARGDDADGRRRQRSCGVDTQAAAARARAIVMEVERGLGFEPTDREFEKLGYDIESRVPGTGKLRFIEVKGRVSGRGDDHRHEERDPLLAQQARRLHPRDRRVPRWRRRIVSTTPRAVSARAGFRRNFRCDYDFPFKLAAIAEGASRHERRRQCSFNRQSRTTGSRSSTSFSRTGRSLTRPSAGATIWFVDDTGGVFDKMAFPTRQEAEACADHRNGFRAVTPRTKRVHQFIADTTAPPFRQRAASQWSDLFQRPIIGNDDAMTVKTRKKLIEVALPLEAINTASAREKSIRHGHPSTLHLWWARRPLAAARAVIFAQMVDDPSAYVTRAVPTTRGEKRRSKESGQRLVPRSSRTWCCGRTRPTKTVLQQARDEIWQSWRRACAENAGPSAREGAVRPQQAARLSRPLRRRRRAAAGGAAARAGELCQRSEPGGGADQQGDDRDPAEVRRASRR